MNLYVSINSEHKKYFEDFKNQIESSHKLLFSPEMITHNHKTIHVDAFNQIQYKNPNNPDLIEMQRKYLQAKQNLISFSHGIFVFNYENDITITQYTEIILAHALKKIIFMFFPMHPYSLIINQLNSLYITYLHKNVEILNSINPNIKISNFKKLRKK